MGRLKTQKEFEEEVQMTKGIEYTVLGDYINNKTQVRMLHTPCGTGWNVRPDNFLKTSGCPECSKVSRKEKMTMAKEQFLTKLSLLDTSYTLIGALMDESKELRLNTVFGVMFGVLTHGMF